MTTQTSLQRTVLENKLDEQGVNLTNFVNQRRTEGASWDTIAAELHTLTDGYTVSSQTLINWYRQDEEGAA